MKKGLTFRQDEEGWTVAINAADAPCWRFRRNELHLGSFEIEIAVVLGTDFHHWETAGGDQRTELLASLLELLEGSAAR